MKLVVYAAFMCEINESGQDVKNSLERAYWEIFKNMHYLYAIDMSFNDFVSWLDGVIVKQLSRGNDND